MADASDYVARKAQGLATVAKIGAAYAVALRRFDPASGAELTPDVQSVDVAVLEQRREALLVQVADIDAMIADCLKA